MRAICSEVYRTTDRIDTLRVSDMCAMVARVADIGYAAENRRPVGPDLVLAPKRTIGMEELFALVPGIEAG